jgi:hypothetical protein
MSSRGRRWAKTKIDKHDRKAEASEVTMMTTTTIGIDFRYSTFPFLRGWVDIVLYYTVFIR